ncbi:peptidase [uncultured Bifidobacterium sp.]|uniref:peptidase n=1 Tax=uncultured Bifidobacterium sp. TaxID=165187 RepID=UPI0026234CBC|nr:peptidase [uncultured Bifidobacterium sp.]
MNARMKRGAAMFAAIVLAMALAVVAVLTAGAATESETLTSTVFNGDYSLRHVSNGRNLFLGAIGVDSRGRKYYCVETSQITDFRITGSTRMTGDDAARLAWLLDAYSDTKDAATHAALALLAHDHHDVDVAQWKVDRAALVERYPDVPAKAASLWDESRLRAPVSVRVSNEYADSLRSGAVSVSVHNVEGGYVEGVPYRLVLKGGATFEDGESALSGVSGTAAKSHAWTALTRGTASVTAAIDVARLDWVDGTQDLVRFGGNHEASAVVDFDVRKDFVPTIRTTVSDKVVDAGDVVDDVVTSGMAEDGGSWKTEMRLDAQGWYFEGIAVEDRGKPIHSTEGESAKDFLDRLAEEGYEPSGYSTASFTAPGQIVTARAMTTPGGSVPYTAKAAGIGTWVWAFSRESLSAQAAEYVTDDVVSSFLDVSETLSVRSTVDVRSVVTEHTTVEGSEISDTITVSGFPDDHGDFAGDSAIGLDADNPDATVSVWWAGDVDDPDNNEDYRPQGDEVPQEDDHHRLIGTWMYSARNGVIRVGGGAPDASGEAVTITAENSGWYVFVWSFAGDDRVAPTSSSYGDAWERVRVWPVPESPSSPEDETAKRVEIVTSVDPDSVDIGEGFLDRATVTGDVPDGAVVRFTAYEAVDEGVDPGLNGKLLDGVEVPLDCAQGAEGCLAVSPQTRSSRAGLVYWSAVVLSSEGDVLASHELGVPGEVVTVREKYDAPTLAAAGSSSGAPVVVAVASGVGGVLILLAVFRARRRRR